MLRRLTRASAGVLTTSARLWPCLPLLSFMDLTACNSQPETGTGAPVAAASTSSSASEAALSLRELWQAQRQPGFDFEQAEIEQLLAFAGVDSAEGRAELSPERAALGERVLLGLEVWPGLTTPLKPLERFRWAQRMSVFVAWLSSAQQPQSFSSLLPFRQRLQRLYPLLAASLTPGGEVTPASFLTQVADLLRGLVSKLQAAFRTSLAVEERRAVLASRPLVLSELSLPKDRRAAFEAVSANDTLLDAVLGIRYEQTEAMLLHGPDPRRVYGNAETYIENRLSDNDLQTLYEDLERVFARLDLQANQSLVDLGSGYGRVGLYLGLTRPQVAFVGYELVKERVNESRRVLAGLNFPRVQFEERDLAAKDFTPAAADYYFAYDPVDSETQAKIFADLRRIAEQRRVVVVAWEGRGKFQKAVRQQCWLKEMDRLPSSRPMPLPKPFEIVVFESSRGTCR